MSRVFIGTCYGLLPVLAKEDKVSLVVEGDHAPALVVGVGVEETGQQARHAVAKARVEVVEDHLRPVFCHPIRTLVLIEKQSWCHILFFMKDRYGAYVNKLINASMILLPDNDINTNDLFS
jgi:hypothetical protein